jgi:hypothetical protein
MVGRGKEGGRMGEEQEGKAEKRDEDDRRDVG